MASWDWRAVECLWSGRWCASLAGCLVRGVARRGGGLRMGLELANKDGGRFRLGLEGVSWGGFRAGLDEDVAGRGRTGCWSGSAVLVVWLWRASSLPGLFRGLGATSIRRGDRNGLERPASSLRRLDGCTGSDITLQQRALVVGAARSTDEGGKQQRCAGRQATGVCTGRGGCFARGQDGRIPHGAAVVGRRAARAASVSCGRPEPSRKRH